MAYSDYGAFVYRDLGRRRDREDVGAFGDGTPDSGYGIYHAVLGDGDVRLCIYKTSASNAELMYLPDENSDPERISVYEYLRTECERDLPEPSEACADFKSDDYKWFSRNCYGPFNHTFSFHGRTVTLSYDEHRKVGGYAKLVEPDGTEWQAWYDNGFGAGLVDERFTDKWDMLDFDTKAIRPYVEKAVHLHSGVVESVEIAFEGIVDDDMHPIAAVWAAPVSNAEGDNWGVRLFASTSDDVGAVTSVDDLMVALINYGIRLGREGVDQVAWNSSSSGKSVPFFEFAHAARCSIPEDRFFGVEECDEEE